MSATSETHRLIALTSARLRQDIDAGIPTESGRQGERAMRWHALREAAWGPDERPLSADQLLALASGLPGSVMIDVSGVQPGCAFPPPIGRIILNMLLLAAESLPSGGDVIMAGSANDLFMRIEGAGAAWPARTGECLVDENAAQSVMAAGGNAQMTLTALLAHAAGVRLSFLLSPGAGSGPPILRLGGH